MRVEPPLFFFLANPQHLRINCAPNRENIANLIFRKLRQVLNKFFAIRKVVVAIFSWSH